MKVSGKMIKHMGQAIITILMGHVMKESGSRINSMGRGMRRGRTGLGIQVTIIWVENMGRGIFCGRMGPLTRDNLRIIMYFISYLYYIDSWKRHI